MKLVSVPGMVAAPPILSATPRKTNWSCLTPDTSDLRNDLPRACGTQPYEQRAKTCDGTVMNADVM